MSRRLSTAVVAAVLAGGLALTGAVAASAAPAAATPVVAAKVAPKARLTVSKVRTSSVTKPFALTTTSRLPVLTGSTAKNRARVAKHAKALVAAERAMVASWRDRCGGSLPAAISVTGVSKAVYKNRFASVTLSFDSDAGCGGVGQQSARSFTLDLKTGKKVKLSRFVAPSAAVTRAAIVSALRTQNPDCVNADLTAFWGEPSSLPTASAWNVSAKGVRVWFDRYDVAPGACGAVSALLPWADVASSGQMKGARSTRVYVRDLKVAGDSFTGDIAVLTVQGRLVARIDGTLFSEAFCTLGVRSGKAVSGFERGSGTRHDFTLVGSTKAPELSLDGGFRLATAAEIAGLKKAGVGADAIKGCGA